MGGPDECFLITVSHHWCTWPGLHQLLVEVQHIFCLHCQTWPSEQLYRMPLLLQRRQNFTKAALRLPCLLIQHRKPPSQETETTLIEATCYSSVGSKWAGAVCHFKSTGDWKSKELENNTVNLVWFWASLLGKFQFKWPLISWARSRFVAAILELCEIAAGDFLSPYSDESSPEV